MRLAPLVAALLVCCPAVGSAEGLPVDRFVLRWESAPSSLLQPSVAAASARPVAARPAMVPEGVLSDALRSAADARTRRDLTIDAMATGWEPSRRAALEDVRDAQRAYDRAGPGDGDSTGPAFLALLRQAVDGTGRSVAQDSENSADVALDTVYSRVIRDASDSDLPKIEASENSWIAYRDQFARFAQVMDHSDAAATIRADLARHRAEALQRDFGR